MKPLWLTIYFGLHAFLMNFPVEAFLASTFLRVSKFHKNKIFMADDITISDSRRKNVGLYQNGENMKPLIPNIGLTIKPEVLSPAGGWPQLRAAVGNGADAVYFGLQDGFNARARANNFAVEELNDVMSYLHERGVRGYVAVNILVFDDELERLAVVAKKMAEAGVDALIVQDIGAVELIRRVAPNLPIHGSTQMSITDAKGASFAKSLGVERVVVGRELSVSDISSVASGSDVEIEAFVHGALCVSYSGQCFSSEAWGGRSANRGQCAQACRMPYGLVLNGTLKDMQDLKYLLSPQDLMALDLVPDLITAGVGCFKIEGRLKAAEYVALTTRAYRAAVDEAWAALHCETDANGEAKTFHGPDAETRLALSQVFARGQDETFDGLSRGFLDGPRHQSLVRGRSPRHRGVLVGRVEEVLSPSPRGDKEWSRGGGVVIRTRPETKLKRGDGVVFDHSNPQENEEGGSIFDIYSSSRSSSRGGSGSGSGGSSRGWRSIYGTSGDKQMELTEDDKYLITFGTGSVNLNKVSVGDLVWRSKDAALDSKLRVELKAVDAGTTVGNIDLIGVHLKVSGGLDKPLVLELVDNQGRVGRASTDSLLQTATRTNSTTTAAVGLTAKDLAKAIGQLGGTPLRAVPNVNGDYVDVSALQPGLFVPMSEVKAARRKAVDALLALRKSHNRDENVRDPVVFKDVLSEQTVLVSREVAQTQSDEPAHGGEGMRESIRDHVPMEEEELLTESQISVLCRTPDQVRAAIELPWLGEVVLDFLEAHGLKDAVLAVQAAGKIAVVATPRIIKPDERRLWVFYLRLKADALLLRSAGLLQQLLELGGAGQYVSKEVIGGDSDILIPELRGDFSLNAANSISTASFLRQGLSRLAPTHDLNAEQICALSRALSPQQRNRLEVIVHQHLPIFHTEHCVFCRFLSEGNSFRDCGKPCEKNSLSLRDMDGADHLVLADMGCRNTVFNAQAQSGAQYIQDFQASGIRRYRIELVDEPASIVVELLQRYRRAIDVGESQIWQSNQPVADLLRWLREVPNAYGMAQGVSAGSLFPAQEKSRDELKPTAKRN